MTCHDEDFAENYAWLKSFHMSDTRIAAMMGISESALQKRCQRAAIPAPCSPQISARLHALIASGRPFDIGDFPAHTDPHQIATALSTAHRGGHITALRTRNHPLHRSRITVYQASQTSVSPTQPTRPEHRSPAAPILNNAVT